MTPSAGPTHPNWKHGRRSKWIPARLADKYAASLEDPQLTEFRQDIALLESRLYELLETGESLPLWNFTRDAFRELRKAMAEKDVLSTTHFLSELEGFINRGMADALRWAEVYKVTDQIGKTKEREHKRLVQTQQMISAEQFLAVLGQIADAAKRTITNRDELTAFGEALNSFGTVATGSNDRAGH